MSERKENQSSEGIPTVCLNDDNINEKEFEQKLNMISALKDRKDRTEALMLFLTQLSANMRVKLKRRVCLFDQNYIDTLIKNDLSGDAQEFCPLLFMSIPTVRAVILGKFLDKKKRTNFINSFCALTNTEIKTLQQTYARLNKKSLLEEMQSVFKEETVQYVLSPICSRPDGSEPNTTNGEQIASNLKSLLDVKKIDLAAVSSLFVRNPLVDINLAVQLLKKQSFDLDDSLKDKVKKANSQVYEAILAIIDVANSRYTFYSDQLIKSMKGLGTDDDLLRYLVLTRSETDLQSISLAFDENPRNNGDTLKKWIKDDTKNVYRELLFGLCDVLDRKYKVTKRSAPPTNTGSNDNQVNSLNQQIQKLTKEKQSLTIQNGNLGSEVTAVKKENDTLKKQLSDLQNSNSGNQNEYSKQINTLRSNLENTTKEKENLTKEIERLTRENKTLSQKISTLEDTKKDNEYVRVETSNDDDTDKLRQENVRLSNLVSELETARDKLTSQVDTLNSQVAEKDEEMEQLRKQLESNSGETYNTDTLKPKNGVNRASLLLLGGTLGAVSSAILMGYMNDWKTPFLN